MTVAESLIEFKKQNRSDFARGKSKSGGDKFKGKQVRAYTKEDDAKTSKYKGNSSRDKDKNKKNEQAPLTCFLCDGPHLMWDYPRRAKLSAIAGGEEAPEPEKLKLGAIMLSSVQTKKFSKQKGLMFVDAVVAGTKLSALVDTGASNLFISERTTKKLGIPTTKGKGWIKTVNSKEVPTLGTTQGVELKLGEWSGKVTIEVIPLDDYDFVIGLDFLDKINALLVPFAIAFASWTLDANVLSPCIVSRDQGYSRSSNCRKGLSEMSQRSLPHLTLMKLRMKKPLHQRY